MSKTEMEKLGIKKSDAPDDSTGQDLTVPMLQDTVYLRIKSTLRPKNARYTYVAKMQCSKYAVIAVHTLDEIFLFNRLLLELQNSSATRNSNNSILLNYQEFAFKWNTIADGISIFYKTAEHIEKHYNHWKDQDIARKTHTMHISVIEALQEQIKHNYVSALVQEAAIPAIPGVPNESTAHVLFDPSLSLASPSSIHPPLLAQQQQQPYNAFSTYLPIPRIRAVASMHGKGILPQPLTQQLPLLNHPIYYRHAPQPFQPYPMPSNSNNSHPYIARTRSCRGCGNQSCAGGRRRDQCIGPKCLTCGRTENCQGIWGKFDCNKS